jgi:A/G-specific adenine glycosylase
VIIQRGKVLLAQRPSNGLLGGMWEFPNGRINRDPAKELSNALKTGYKLKVRMLRVPRAERSRRRSRSADHPEALGSVQHGYSHFSVTVHVFLCELISIPKETNLKWVSLNKLQEYPMGKIDRQIARMIA